MDNSEIEALLNEAEQHIMRNEDNAALRKLETFCDSLDDMTNEQRELFIDRAGRTLIALRRTDNEYVWERTGHLLQWLL